MVPPTCCWSALLLYREALGTKYKGYTPAELRLPLGCDKHPRTSRTRQPR